MTLANNIAWLNHVNWTLLGVYVVPALSAMLSYFFGKLSSSINQKRSVQAERYKNLYLPAISIILEYQYWTVKPHIRHKSIVEDFYPIINENLGLLDSDSAMLFSNFMMPCFTYKIKL